VIHHDYPQGSEAWLSIRQGVITGSRFKDARDRLKNGELSKAARLYAMDLARERVGGKVQAKFQNAAMREGTEQEPLARMAYEAHTGHIVEEVGFITTDDMLFGVSADGLVNDDGVLEIKTMVSSDTLFTAVVSGDISEYIDQINGYLWLLNRQWVDLVLWAPDLEQIGMHMTVRRITRDDNEIEKLEADLVYFSRIVSEYETKLREKAVAFA
jgi:hypothetical protein